MKPHQIGQQVNNARTVPISATEQTSSSDQEKRDHQAAAKIEKGRTTVLSAIAGAKLDTLQEPVAWILNHVPKTRDSDVALQIEYWRMFEPELLGGDSIALDDLYKARRLTSIARARAKIQNTYKLFQASPDVQRYRGTIEEEEYEKALKQRPDYPIFSIYADESGKTGKFLLVGSVWFLHTPEILSLTNKINDWRDSRKFTDEFHFQKIAAGNVSRYYEFVDMLAEAAATVSFNAISLERRGVPNVGAALEELYYFLLLRGVEQENTTGRSPLPRGLMLYKDAEEPGSDNLMLAKIHDRLAQVASTRFNDQLFPEEFVAVDSKGQTFVQVADLFASSLNRILNGTGKGMSPKDEFARYFLKRVDMPDGPNQSEEATGDITVLVRL